jgi:phospholipid/cholesterol/gamma-HCH transport system ATP-binding protein
MIELEQLDKRFGEHHVLKNVSASFEKGKVNFVIGRSGSGKSVMTKCVVGLLEPDVGRVLYDGRDFTGMSKPERRLVRQEIGMLFQGSALFDSMTVEENVMFPLRMFSDQSEMEIRKRAHECLARVELEGAEIRFPAEVSGGMKKRVGIARAIAMNPKYLFCDEPNSGLDPQTAIVIDNLIKDITYDYGMTTVVVSHDMNSVMEASDTIHFVHEGGIVWNGTRHELLSGGPRELEDFVFASDLMRQIRRAKNDAL